MLPGLTVVISPLISLMKDQVDALVKRGIAATFVNSTLSSGEVSERMARVYRGEIKLLYLAPERFAFGDLGERLSKVGVSLLAVDEAHCISEWGHDFRPSYLRIGEIRDKLRARCTMALTATATPRVRADIVRQLELSDAETIVTGFDRTNLTYYVAPARSDDDKDELLVRFLREREGLAVVYASTRKAVERIAELLRKNRIPAAAYHAGLDDERRHQVQEAFMKEKVRAIVATNAFGMGIDKANVRLVIHHAMPGTLEAYYQEAGRGGATASQRRRSSSTRSATGSRTNTSSRAHTPSAPSWRPSTSASRKGPTARAASSWMRPPLPAASPARCPFATSSRQSGCSCRPGH
jgi:ATP-dependent DNA helicase RecQ